MVQAGALGLTDQSGLLLQVNCGGGGERNDIAVLRQQVHLHPFRQAVKRYGKDVRAVDGSVKAAVLERCFAVVDDHGILRRSRGGGIVISSESAHWDQSDDHKNGQKSRKWSLKELAFVHDFNPLKF